MNYGEMISISCGISGGDLPIHVTWLKNDYPLTSNENLYDIMMEQKGKRLFILLIESVSAKHIGNYTCRAENEAGVVEFASELKVNGLFIES